ncbi:MAG TPA: 2-amino-4-hydroxy-6-hydroxymethyldihydropteridine diphosphokinase [Spongiibacteraceae bacterium]|nr:2-amino-4-hydroxy-6-hydroxymethyldihydropteridine diphosphokinase [Spongiibacteraceae bacterium]
MTQVFIGIGSNIERGAHITAALDRLAAEFGDVLLSPVYESEAIGFSGAAFFNLVARIDTELSVGELVALLRGIERANGHGGNTPKFSDRSLDLDLLTYGDVNGVVDNIALPRADIVDYAYVLWPLADIAGDALHPALGISYRALKQKFTAAQKLWPVSFLWRGRDLSELFIPATARELKIGR